MNEQQRIGRLLDIVVGATVAFLPFVALRLLEPVLKVDSSGSEPFEHEMNHSYINPSLRTFSQSFVVFAEPSVSAQPSKGALHNPSARQHLKAMAVLGALDHLNQPPSQNVSPIHQVKVEALLQPDGSLVAREVEGVGGPEAGSVSEPSKVEINGKARVEPPAKSPRRRGSITLTGRTEVWAEGLRLYTESPVLGYGFQADRLLLGAHMHNSYIHALLQAGGLGIVPFVAALLMAWVLLLNLVRNRARLPTVHRHLLIQVVGIAIFLSARTITESTGAFFGVDWLLLAPLLMYLQVLSRAVGKGDEAA